MRNTIDSFHEWLKRLNSKILEKNHVASWIVIAGLVALIIPVSFLRIQTDMTDIMDNNTPDILFYKKTVKAFPKFLNMTALIERSGHENLSDKDFQNIQEWTESIERETSVVSSVMSPFQARMPLYEEEKSILTFPKIINSEQGEWEKLRASFWGPFFLGNNNRTLLVSVKIKNHLSIQQLEKFRQEHSQISGLSVNWTGDGAFQLFTNEGITKMNYLNILGIAALMLIFWLFYRSSIICFYAFLALFLGIGPVLGMMGVAGQSLDLLTSNLFLLLVVASLEDIFLVFYFSSQKKISIKDSLKLTLIPSMYTSLTTALGFGSLYISNVPAIKNFAIWSSIGAMSEWVIVFFVVPTFFMNKLDQKISLQYPFSWLNTFFAKVSFPGRGRFIILIPIFMTPFLFGHLSFNASPFDIFSETHPIVKIKNKIKATRGWEHYISLIFEKEIDSKTKKDILLKIEKVKNIGWVEHPLLMIGDHSKNPDIESLIVDNLKMTPMADQYYSKGMERGFVYLKNSDIDSVNEIKKAINDICRDDCRLSGELVAFGEYSKALVETLSESLLLSLGLVFSIIVFLCWYLKISQWHKLFLSILWGPCVMVLFFVVTKTSITLVNCILLSTISGLSGDSAIQFIFNKKENSLKNSIEEIGPGSLMLTLVLLILCLPFFLSPFGNVQTAGYLLMVSLSVVCIGDYVVLKNLL